MRFVPCVLASVFYGIKPTLINSAIRAGESGNALEFWSLAIASLLAAGLVGIKGNSLRVSKRQLGEMAFFGFSGFFLCNCCLLAAYQTLPVSTTLLFHFSYPVWVCLCMTGIFGQRMTAAKAAAVALSLGGVGMMADFGGGLSISGCVFAVLSGVFYGLYIIACEKCQFANLPAAVKIFYLSMGSSLGFAICMLISHERFAIGPAGIGCAAAVAVMTGVLAVMLMMRSVHLIGAGTTTVLNNLEQVVGVVISVLVFNEAFTAKTLIACAMILGGSVLAGISSQKEKTLRKETVAVCGRKAG